MINVKLLAVPCKTSSDCKDNKPKTVCQESPESGEKTCVEPKKSTCKEDCPESKYCSAENKCKNGKCWDYISLLILIHVTTTFKKF